LKNALDSWKIKARPKNKIVLCGKLKTKSKLFPSVVAKQDQKWVRVY
jgi:hypothetical protein